MWVIGRREIKYRKDYCISVRKGLPVVRWPVEIVPIDGCSGGEAKTRINT